MKNLWSILLIIACTTTQVKQPAIKQSTIDSMVVKSLNDSTGFWFWRFTRIGKLQDRVDNLEDSINLLWLGYDTLKAELINQQTQINANAQMSYEWHTSTSIAIDTIWGIIDNIEYPILYNSLKKPYFIKLWNESHDTFTMAKTIPIKLPDTIWMPSDTIYIYDTICPPDTVPEPLPITDTIAYAFPGAEGFGSLTKGAYNGLDSPAILIVDNLSDDNIGNESTGKGSFRWCVTRTYPRIILFEVGGTIELTESHFQINNPYMFIAGQTAPSPGILIINGELHIRTHDIAIQYISIRPGDNPNIGSHPDGRDCISIRNFENCHDIIIDHCSLLWAIDECISMWGGGQSVRNVTISNCIIAQGLNNSLHDEGPHSKGLLVGYNSKNISVIKNLFAHNNDRNPLLQGGSETEVINNISYNGWHSIVFSNHADLVSKSSVINNIVVGGYDWDAPYAVRLAELNNNSQIYISGTRGDWNDIYGASHEPYVRVDYPPISSDRVEIVGNTEDYVLTNAGSRPWERNEADQNVIDQYVNHTGRVIDCPSGCSNSAGGWYLLSFSYRELIIPYNPHEIAENHYTNLQNWIKTFELD